MKLTLDTTNIFDLFKQGKDCIKILIEDAHNGLCELVVTSRIYADIPEEPLASELNKLSELGIETIGTIARWGVSYWGEDYWSGDETEELESKIRKIMFPGKEHEKHLNDIDHLIGHIINERDYFITSDSHFLRRYKRLYDELGVKVISPEEYVNSIRLTHRLEKV